MTPIPFPLSVDKTKEILVTKIIAYPPPDLDHTKLTDAGGAFVERLPKGGYDITDRSISTAALIGAGWLIKREEKPAQ